MAIKKTMDMYICEKCGKMYSDEYVANICCKQYHCEVCGKETQRYYLKCPECQENARFEKARKMTIAEYEAEFSDCMVYDGSDYYCSVEDLLEAYIWGSREECDMPNYCYGTTRVYMKLEPDEILNHLEEELGCEGIEISEAGYKEFREFANAWNEKYQEFCYFMNDDIVILIPPELKEEFKNG